MSSSINSCKQKTLKVKTEDKPVTCYKIFEVYGNTYYGPFTNYKFDDIEAGKTIKAEYKVNERFLKFKKWFPRLYKLLFTENNINYKEIGKIEYNSVDGWWEISEGFIHTLSYCPQDFKSYCDRPGEYELWECEIPANTMFFKADCRGSHYEANDSYASKEIKLLRLVDICKVTYNDVI